MNRIDVLGVEFDDMDIVEAVELAMSFMDERRCAYAVTPNPEIVLASRKNRKLASAVRAADMVLADGVGVIYASHILGTPIKNRIPGIDFASALMARMSECGKKVFLLGAKPGVAELAGERLSERYPGLDICGVNDGYFEEEDNELVLEKINAQSPDLVLVCLGAPKQEFFMQRLLPHLNRGVMLGVGAAFSFYLNELKDYKFRVWEIRMNWILRLLTEPKKQFWRVGSMMLCYPRIYFKEKRKWKKI